MMNRWYIYKLTFMNGCTYIGKHHQIRENDKYVTSSSYYHNKGGKDILLKREVILDNLSDSDTCDIMETICILHDRAENINNVNYNKGGWVSNQFDRGFSGAENGMYGKHIKDMMSPESFEAMNKKRNETKRKKYQARLDSGEITPMLRRKIIAERNRKFREINKQISIAHKEYDKYLKSLPKKWYYNPDTLEETYSYELPDDNWIKGRLPHSLWPEYRKQSYSEKHSFNPIERMSELDKQRRNDKLSKNMKGRVCYTNGKDNIYLWPGQDVPDGYTKGCTFEKTELYIKTRTGRRKNNG